MTTKSLADAFDDYVNWVVLWMFLTSINLAMEASAFLLSKEVGRQVRAWAHLPTRAGIVILFVAIFLYARRRWKAGWKCGDCAFMDGYTMDIVKRSAVVAFLVTLMSVALLDNVTNNTELPADFYIKLPGVTLTATFSLCFFFWNRSPRGGAEEEVLP